MVFGVGLMLALILAGAYGVFQARSKREALFFPPIPSQSDQITITIDREVADEASQEVSESVDCSRGGDGPYAMGDITPSRFPITRTLSHREASIANAAYAAGVAAGKGLKV